MEARLAVALTSSAATAVSFAPPPAPALSAASVSPTPSAARPTSSVAAAPEVAAAPAEEASAPWPDDAAESAFRAEARERGETVTPPAASEVPEVVDPKSLPSLDSLVQRIPPQVRETLEDLFRARFVKVDQVSAKALKG